MWPPAISVYEVKNMMNMDNILYHIEPVKEEWKEKAQERLNALAIPTGSLGVMTSLAEQLVAIAEDMTPRFPRKEVFVMAGDHGVTEEGVSLFPKEVTTEMVGNFLKGGAGINAFAQNAGAKVNVVDMGVDARLDRIYGKGCVMDRKINFGTKNFTKEPAMTREEATQALECGIQLVIDAKSRGADLIATGDMGIANTSASTAVFAALSGLDVREITGRGTGLDDEAMERKAALIEKAILLHRPCKNDPVGILAKLGGFEIGGIAGLILGAAYCRIPVLLDGYISTAGALLATTLAPACKDYIIAAHMSHEKAHKAMLDYMDLRPLLHLDLRLGEGTGAALAMPIIDAASSMLEHMLTFEEANVHNGNRS